MNKKKLKRSIVRKNRNREKTRTSRGRKLLKSLFSQIDLDAESVIFKRAFWVCFSIISLIMVTFSLKSPINADDVFRNYHSEKLLLFYTSFGKDTSSFHHPRAPLKYYGGFYEVIAGAINASLNLDIYDHEYHQIRHGLNAVFGAAGILFVGLIAVLIGGWQTGLLAMLMAFLSPRLFGHSLMNPKDIPFAAGYVICLYFILKWALTYPKITFSTNLGLILGIGVATGIRVGGVILLPIFWTVGLITILHTKASFFTHIKSIIIPSILGLVLALLFWPYGLTDPIRHIPESIRGFSEYFVSIRLLFMGDMIYSSQIPFYYLPVWVLVSSPIFIWIGFLFFISGFKAIWNQYQKLGIVLLIGASVLPLGIAIIGSSSLYDGWRHFLFVYGTFIPLFALGLMHLLVRFKKTKLQVILMGIICLTFLEPLIFIVRNSSYPYIYFNPVVGGINKAYGKFETDYWGLSVVKGIDWLQNQNLLPETPSDTIHIVTNFDYHLKTSLRKMYGERVQVTFSHYRDRDNHNWDYGIFTSRFIPGEHLREDLWPERTRLVNTIYSGRTPLAVILQNSSDLSYRAHEEYRNEEYPKAILILNDVLRQNPDNEACWILLGQSLMRMGQYERAEKAYQKAIELAPMDDGLYNHIGINLIQQGKDQEGLNSYQKALVMNPRNTMSYYFMALYYRENNNLQKALDLGMQCIRADGQAKPCYDMVSEVYRRLGNNQNANYYQRLAESVN